MGTQIKKGVEEMSEHLLVARIDPVSHQQKFMSYIETKNLCHLSKPNYETNASTYKKEN